MSRPKIIEVKKHEHYRTIFVSGVYGGHRPGFFEAIIYTDELEAEEALSSLEITPSVVNIRRIIQCRLIFDPFQAKSFLEWLKRHVEEYEKKFGEIKLPKRAEEKGRIYG